MLSAPRKNKKRFYKTREYSNPFFNRHAKYQRENRFILKLFKLLALLIIIFALGIVFFSDYFTIKNIKTAGEGSHTQEINNLAWERVNSKSLINNQKNILFFNKKIIAGILEENYFFDSLIIKKDFPDTILIDFKEKKYSLVWAEEGKYYFINLDGNIIKEIATSTDNIINYPIIENRADKSISGKTVMDRKKEIEYTHNLFEIFKNEKTDFIAEKFIIDYDAYTIKVATNKQTVIYFNIEESPDGQMAKLMIFIKEKLQNSFGGQEYIDLRYGDKIYYK